MNHTDRRKPNILIDPVNFYQTYGNILQRQSTPTTTTPPIPNLGQNFQSNQPILEGLISNMNNSNYAENSNISPIPTSVVHPLPMKQASSMTPSNLQYESIPTVHNHSSSIAQQRDDFLLNSVRQNGVTADQQIHSIDLDALALEFPNISQDIWNTLFDEQNQHITNSVSPKPIGDTSSLLPNLPSQPVSLPVSSPPLSNNVVSEVEVYKQLQKDNQQQVLELQEALKKQGDLLKQMSQLKQQNEILMQSLLETYQSMQQQLQQVKSHLSYIERPISNNSQEQQFVVPHFQATPLVSNQQLQSNMVWNKSNIHTLMQSNQVMTQHHLQAFANLPMSIWDRHTLELIGFNTAFLQLVGRTEQELMTTGFCIHHLAPPHTRFVFETIQRCLVKARIYHFEGSQTIYRPQYNDTIYLTSSYYFDTNIFTCTHRRIPKNDDHFVIENKVFAKDFELDEKNPQVFQNFLYYKMNKYVSELQKYH